MTTIQGGFNPFGLNLNLNLDLPGGAAVSTGAAMHLYALLGGGQDAFTAGGQSGYTPMNNGAAAAMGFVANMALLAQLGAIMQQLNQSQGAGQMGQFQLPGGAMPGMMMNPAEMAWLMIQYFANAMQQRNQGGGGCRCAGHLSNGGFSRGRSVGTWGGNGGTPTSTRGAGVGQVPTGRGTAGDFLNAALAQNGDRYVYGAETNLNDANPHTFDCSELVQWAAHQAGVSIPDGSSNQRAASIPISVEEAMRTPGALLFRNGHVAISLGDGRTIEAKGSRHGVGIFNASGRFTSGGLIPGMSYG